ncbi:MAG: hypothetical protein U9R48_07160 [Chloroflexota bacterium]|nr:hypothetical protein [Chloroflexota bacterium]
MLQLRLGTGRLTIDHQGIEESVFASEGDIHRHGRAYNEIDTAYDLRARTIALAEGCGASALQRDVDGLMP